MKFESLENAKALDQVEKGWSWFLLHLRSKSYQAREKKISNAMHKLMYKHEVQLLDLNQRMSNIFGATLRGISLALEKLASISFIGKFNSLTRFLIIEVAHILRK